MKNKLLFFLCFVAVIAVISGGLTGWVFQRKMAGQAQETNLLIKKQALMIRVRGMQLEKIAFELISFAESQNKRQARQLRFIQTYGHEIGALGAALQNYATDILKKNQKGTPRKALISMAEINLSIPEDLHAIKTKNNFIGDLERDIMKLRSDNAILRSELYLCRSTIVRQRKDSK